MQKKSIGKLLLGTWDTKTIVGIAIGAALFGVLMDFGGIRVFSNTSLTSAMIVIPVVAGLFGPLPAALAAGIGNVLADLIGGWGFWFDWSIGNFVLGFIVGLLPVYGARIDEGVFTAKHIVIYIITVVVGNVIAFGAVTPLFTYFFYSGELAITWMQGVSAILSNGVVLIVIGTPLLYLLAKRNAKKTNLEEE